ncbi:glycogen/starch synthase [Allostreptomyces psammosilenae]|uniref:D-inositol 3-phosphate glycosyltransferase n=1 Tax=Allostreptomyces psammosilenae TaxID=1892865 RepID=A0A852ZPD3_9ACTN|nr:glycogen/starch synthase [Allostreptomyces psammosilenae]NYI04219.1 hypothetical protein [Allostreptomyces psammosilenae]
MHIVSLSFECGAFDVRMMRGGLSPLTWNLARAYAAAGHRVSIVTPAHGRLDELRRDHEIEELDYLHDHVVPLVPDPAVWPDLPAELPLPLTTRAHRLSREGVDVYFLSNAQLDLLPERFYPRRDSEGRDLSFFKPLVFQVDGIRFIEQHLGGGEPMVVQGFEPYYCYLLPAVYHDRPDRITVTTVASNMPINQAVHRPQVERLLELFDVKLDLAPLADPPADDPLGTAMRAHLPATRLYRDHGPDGVPFFSIVAAHSDLVDFLSPGQRTFYSTFRDTPFERLYQRLTVSRLVRENAHRHLVGGCAISDSWLARDPDAIDRDRLLRDLGLDPSRPTFYHAARHSVQHKGQMELMRAVERVLSADPEVNFLIRLATGTGGADPADAPAPGDPAFQRLAERYPDNIHLDWRMVGEDTLFAQAACADFCVYPSKFELDAFLIAQGEAMACGAVPVATAQEVTGHFRHALPRRHPDATGFATRRSFREDDPLLADDLTARLLEAARVFRDDPEEYRRLSGNARRLARGFTWERCARTRLEAFEALSRGRTPGVGTDDALRHGWFDLLDEDAWSTHRLRVAERAAELADPAAYRRCAPLDGPALRRLHDAAHRRGDLARCAELEELAGPDGPPSVRDRCRVRPVADGWAVSYRLPHAERVELLSGDVACDLSAQGGVFRTVLADAPSPEGQLIFLITLASGRIAWDSVPFAHAVEGARSTATLRTTHEGPTPRHGR